MLWEKSSFVFAINSISYKFNQKYFQCDELKKMKKLYEK